MTKVGRPNETVIARQMLALFEYLQSKGLFDRSAYDSESEDNPRIGVEEIARFFSWTSDEVVVAVTRLACCGLGDYLYVPIYLDDDERFVYGGPFDELAHPLRLSENECRALASALDLAGVPDQNELRTALFSGAGAGVFDQMAFTRGHLLAGTILSTDRREVLARLLSAVEGHLITIIEYPSATDDAGSSSARRRVEPLSVTFENGRWYLNTFCLLRNEWRTFALDSILAVETTDEVFEPREAPPQRFSQRLSTELPPARLEFSSSAVVEKRDWPSSSLIETRPDGSKIIDVPDAGTTWLPTRIIALGDEVRVISPEALRTRTQQLRDQMRTRAIALETRWHETVGPLSQNPDVSSSIFRPYPS